MDTQYSQRGSLSPMLVMTIILGVATVGLAVFGFWSYLNYNDQKNNVDQKIEAAVAEARREQSEEDETKFAEREKQPTKLFVGPEDLGRVELRYPKTWSGYVDKNGSNGTYEAYFQPGVVPPLTSNTPYALRVSIENKAYESVLDAYQDEVKQGEVRSAAATINGESGNRLEGKIDKDIDGVMLLFKVRDKTVKVYTESRAFQADLDNIILPSLIFNR